MMISNTAVFYLHRKMLLLMKALINNRLFLIVLFWPICHAWDYCFIKWSNMHSSEWGPRHVIDVHGNGKQVSWTYFCFFEFSPYTWGERGRFSQPTNRRGFCGHFYAPTTTTTTTITTTANTTTHTKLKGLGQNSRCQLKLNKALLCELHRDGKI